MKLFSSSCRAFLVPVLCAATLPLFAAVTTTQAQDPGDQDTTFATGPAANGSVNALALQPNGQLLVGGAFTNFRNAGRSEVARLNADGSLDTFNPGLALTAYDQGTAIVNALALQANGQVLVAGIFNVLGQTPGGGVARLNADGSLDGSFNVGSGIVDDGGAVGRAEAVVVLSNGQVLVAGAFLSFNGIDTAGIVRLNADGSVDLTFNTGGAGVSANDYGQDVKAIAVQADGKIVIGGAFSAYDGIAAGGVVRLNADGTPDTTFSVGQGADIAVEAVALQANGQILVGGTFNNFDGASVPHIVRLQTNGDLDTSYYPINGVTINEVAAIAVQVDGSALVGGQVNIPQGLISPPGDGLARINADGTDDTGFGSGGSDLRIAALALQPDGKALIAGNANGLVSGSDGDVYRVYDIVISATPTVTIAAGVSKINEDGSSGPATFIVSISAAQSTKTTVKYAIKGSAIAGYDYQTLSGKVKIKPGHTTATITVNPIDEGIDDGSVVKVKVALQAGNGYTVGTASGAKVKIVDNDQD